MQALRSTNSFVRGPLLVLLSVIWQVSAVLGATPPVLSPTNIFSPASTPAKSIAHLSVFVLVINPRHSGRSPTAKRHRSHRHRAPILVGISLSEAGDCDSE